LALLTIQLLPMPVKLHHGVQATLHTRALIQVPKLAGIMPQII
jgi:hypothetical protein